MTRFFARRLAAAFTATRFAAALVAMAVSSAPAHAADASPYSARGLCAGFPRVDLKTPAGTCVALLADGASGLRFPRRVLEVAPGRFWLIDMGSWEAGRGRLLEFTLPPGPRSGPVVFRTLAEKLDRPLGLVRGPDDKVYVGEAGKVWRTAVGAPGAAPVMETVVDHLPSTGSHPLKELAFGAAGKLYVNVGSSSDACRDEAGKQALPCADVEGAAPRATVYEASFGGPGFTLQSFRPFARGLRNSVALAFVPGADVLLQGENSIDYADETAPPEKLDLLRDGAFYGWPYCTGARVPARGYEGRFDCSRTEAPLLLWPAHAAPLQMTAIAAAAKNDFAGQLLIAWHGYRAGGHRIVGYKLGADGRPSGPMQTWVDGWTASPGVRPLGAPTGILVDTQGRLVIVEDRHKTLLMLVHEGR